MKILLGDFNVKLRREDIFKPTIRNGSFHEISNNNAVRLVNFAASKNFIVKVQCSHVVTFLNLLGHLLMERQSNCPYCDRQEAAFRYT
jgi:hypothetical protein